MQPHIAFATAPLLTPRQSRLEGAIVSALQTRSTRSVLREAVYQMVDLFRLQGVSADDGVGRIQAIAMRATVMMTDTAYAVGDSPAERVGCVVLWARQRYARAD